MSMGCQFQGPFAVPFYETFPFRLAADRDSLPLMFIRSTRTGAASDGSPRITHRLVENRRVGGKVRQRTLLNLGRHFAIGRDSWPLPCRRVKELMSGQQGLGFEPLDPETAARQST